MSQIPCPLCKIPLTPRGNALVCDRCGGQWLSGSVLAARMAEAQLDSPPLSHRTPEPTPKRCPYCDSALAPVSMAGVALDQCAEHGMWLDAGELDEVRRQAAAGGEPPRESEAPGRHAGFWSALKDLFG